MVVGAAAFLAGIGVAWPMGWALDPAAAGLIGGLVGAVATIGGAVLLWQLQEKQKSVNLAKAVAMQFGSIFVMCEDLIESLVWRVGVGWDTQNMSRQAKSMVKEIDYCRKKLARFDQALSQLSPDQIGLLLCIELVVDTMRIEGERCVSAAQILETHPSIGKIKITELEESLRAHSSELSNELEKLAPGWSIEAR